MLSADLAFPPINTTARNGASIQNKGGEPSMHKLLHIFACYQIEYERELKQSKNSLVPWAETLESRTKV